MESRPLFELVVQGRKIALGRHTLVMGVLNVTPDSFSDAGLYLDSQAAIAHGFDMARRGADWIDVGGESTRPGSKALPAEEELRRVLPVIRGLYRKAPYFPISIDTTKAGVAERAIRAGASIINDVSGLRFDPALANVARRHGAALVLTHMRGRPETMQQRSFARSIGRSLGRGLAWSIRQALAHGVPRSQLVIDPGLGFGKTRRQNFEILARLGRLRRFGLPIMIGSSRKSFVQAVAAGESLDPAATSATPAPGRKQAGGSPSGPWKLLAALPGAPMQAPLALQVGDAAAIVAAILGGAHIVRVHDAAAMLPAVRIADAILAAAAARSSWP